VTIFIAAGGAGGFVVLLLFVVGIGRGVFRQVNATEDNTAALKDLTAQMGNVLSQLSGHEARLQVLEDRTKR
jgi:hypothetical protein